MHRIQEKRKGVEVAITLDILKQARGCTLQFPTTQASTVNDVDLIGFIKRRKHNKYHEFCAVMSIKNLTAPQQKQCMQAS